MKVLPLSSAAAFWLFIMAHQSTSALACSCLGSASIQSSFESSEAAIWSTISEVLPRPTDQFGSQYYRANADGVAKGCGITRDTDFYIKTNANSALCGVDFLQVNVRYILFGRITQEPIAGRGTVNVLTISLCNANTAYTNIERHTLTFLIHQPVPVCSNNNNQPSVPVMPTSPVRAPVIVRPGSLGTVNCQVCPAGYVDGCNTCRCNNGVATSCSNKVCNTNERGYCTNLLPNNPSPTPPQPVIPAVRWPDPAPVVPSWRAWPTNSSPTATVNNNIVLNCRICPNGYNDGCNNCSCSFGRATCSTEKVCRTNGRPYCSRVSSVNNPHPIATTPTWNNNGQPTSWNQQPVPPQPTRSVGSRNSIINCRSCPNGYYDGCDSCRCQSGRAQCTARMCTLYGPARCSNFN